MMTNTKWLLRHIDRMQAIAALQADLTYCTAQADWLGSKVGGR